MCHVMKNLFVKEGSDKTAHIWHQTEPLFLSLKITKVLENILPQPLPGLLRYNIYIQDAIIHAFNNG